MAAERTPYEDTSVPVARSQGAILELLRGHGAGSVEFGVDDDTTEQLVRFRVKRGPAAYVVRLTVVPLPERDPATGKTATREQRERQAWRGLYWYLEGTLKATRFGLVRFEDVFLSFIQAPDGRTVGDVLVPVIQSGELLQLGSGS